MLGGLLDGIEALVVNGLNALLSAFGTAVQGVVELLPDMPALPTPPAAMLTAESWVAWVFPVGTLLDVLAFVIAMYLLWQLVAIALRWGKAI